METKNNQVELSDEEMAEMDRSTQNLLKNSKNHRYYSFDDYFKEISKSIKFNPSLKSSDNVTNKKG